MKKVAIGVDIGGTNTVFGLVDRDGNLFCEGTISTIKHGDNLDLYLTELCDNISQLIKKCDNIEVIGIGVGAPNANYYTGTIGQAPNLPWKETLYLQREMSQRLGLPSVITNDANAAAIGEMMYGGAVGMRDFMVVTLGTGLGSGIVVNGELMYGHDGFAGELGHIVVVDGGRKCNCGLNGCLETYASATGIKRTAFEMMCNSTKSSHLRDIPFNKLTAKDIADAAEGGDELAKEIFDYTGEILGKALCNFTAIASPKAIFLFGGLAKAGKWIFEPTQKSMEKNMLFVFKDKVKLLPSQIDDKNCAVLGASALAWKDCNNN